jgi:ABC-type glycerol-3-phosphate transport system substrate-binding protein
VQRKRLNLTSVFLILPLGLLVALAGCQRREVVPPPPYKDVRLRVAVPNRVAEAVIREAARGWQLRQQQALPLDIVVYTSEAGPEAVAGADIWVLRPAELGRWAAAEKLRPVPAEALEEQTWTGLLPLYRDKLVIWGEREGRRAAYAYPLLGEAPLFCWRSDVLDNASPTHLPPQTWTDLKDQAASLFASRHEPILPPLPADDEDLERLFYTVAASYVRRPLPENTRSDRINDFAFHFDLDTGRPLINEDGFVRALQLLQDLQAFRPAGTAADPDDAFRDGRAVFTVTDAAALVRFRDQPLGLSQVPGAQPGRRVPYLGSSSWIAVVPTSSPQSEAAFHLLADMAGPETSNQLALAPHLDPPWGGGLMRSEQLDPGVRLESFGLARDRPSGSSRATVADLRDTLRITLRSGAQNPVLPLRIPDQQLYRPVLIRQLRAALGPPEQRPTAKDALDVVAREWKELGDKTDQKTRVAEYRVSVGLSAR